MARRRLAIVALLVVALAGVLSAVLTGWAASRGSSPTGAMMGGGGYGSAMMGGRGAAGTGQRVDSLAAARQRAQTFADARGLRVGEVMQFSNGFYAELNTVDGRHATEVLIDPTNGGVSIEYGPAMMWNTTYGMHGRVAAPAATGLSAADARAAAQRWLDVQRPGLSAGEAEEFPGYFTVHTTQDGRIVGMMSVHATTGAVWYHTWHGQYVGMSEG